MNELPENFLLPYNGETSDVQMADSENPPTTEPYDVYQPLPYIEDIRATRLIEQTLNMTTIRQSSTLPIPGVRVDFHPSTRLDERDHFSEVQAAAHWLNEPFADLQIISPGSISQYRTRKLEPGFDAVEVMRSGALNCFPCRQNDLIYPIHRIFRFENFVNCERRIYEQLEPVWRLASIWLTHPSCHYFWTTLLFGKRSIDVTESLRLRSLAFRVQRFNMEQTAENRLIYDQYLEQLADYITFEFTSEIWKMKNFGTATFPDSLINVFNAGPTRNAWTENSKIQLVADFYTQASKFAALKYPDEACRLRFYFFAAVNVCHEIAHAIEVKTRTTYLNHKKLSMGEQEFSRTFGAIPMDFTLDTMFETQQFGEAGWAWEHDFFGGRVQPINHRVDGREGLLVRPNLDFYGNIEHKSYTVPMGYVEEMQQQAFWDRYLLQPVDRGFFHIPQVGVVGLSTCSMSTLPMRDWLLHEEAKEYEKDTSIPNNADYEHSRPSNLDIDIFDVDANKDEDLIYELLQPLPENQLTVNEQVGRAQKLLSDYQLQPTSGSSTDSSSTVTLDAALKDPARLTLADKWRLAEEFCCLSDGIDAIVFLSLRAKKQLKLPDPIAPWNKNSWGKRELDMLLALRLAKGMRHQFSDQSDPDDRRVELIARKWLWLEEYVVLNGWTRLEFYKKRAAWELDFVQQMRYYPENPDSWGKAELEQLENKKREFQDITRKWAWFEEYTKLRHNLSRHDFLRYKNKGKFDFNNAENAKLNPQDPESWQQPQREMLIRLRYELSPERKQQKWNWFKATWTLDGNSETQLQAFMQNQQTRTDFFRQYPDLDPENPDSWKDDHVRELQRMVVEFVKKTGQNPFNDIMIENNKLPGDQQNQSSTATGSMSDKKRKRGLDERIRGEESRDQARVEALKQAHNADHLAKRIRSPTGADTYVSLQQPWTFPPNLDQLFRERQTGFSNFLTASLQRQSSMITSDIDKSRNIAAAALTDDQELAQSFQQYEALLHKDTEHLLETRTNENNNSNSAGGHNYSSPSQVTLNALRKKDELGEKLLNDDLRLGRQPRRPSIQANASLRVQALQAIIRKASDGTPGEGNSMKISN